MATRAIIGIVALACIATCGMFSTFASWEIMDRVNERLPKEERFKTLWWYASKYHRLHREYKRLYPDGGLVLKYRVLTALMFALLLICAWGFGFFSK
jgi:hypothetical protein